MSSTPSTYTLQTILQKDKAYSTLGIELKSPKAIETYNNNGNFSIKLTNINLQDTKLLFLSFIPFKDNDEANNTKAQKIQI
ncbi:hypothetical protein, partial [Helicobacter sp. MIT 05-5294]|uniref:hypothetical protein n=1 Tax=Helicobacter sp. MIT 05-5294 TaxID=1548150 RepID=UPI0010FE3448